jgi:glycosyltransferase involved in cell wall biosynthesis
VPARNERGNIEAAVARIPDLRADVEVLFVEGHSTDGTWQEIERVAAGRPHVRALRQTGRGKSDAVRLGFAEARGELVTILDADLTMPPEKLASFYEAYVGGRGDFVNGSRLVYPMEGAAMRFLNHLGNIFFAKALSSVLDMRVGDSLCGTKLLARHDYERFVRWRKAFGEFDPFGDFELLFPAAVLGIGSIDVPVHYRARTYGTTQIRRFRDGLVLLQMVVTGFFDIKMGRVP